MTKQVEVVFEQGVLRPPGSTSFSEKEHLFITVSDLPKPTTDRAKEQFWLDANSTRYQGIGSRSTTERF